MERRLEIDTIRGVACFLLVAYHVVGEPDTGLRITDGILRDLNDFLAYIRMPLFTFLSGYVYAWRPYSDGAQGFITGKARRLLLPMLAVGTVFAVLQAAVPGTNAAVANWYLLHIIPVAHFWFVESLFLIFLLILLLEVTGALSTLPRTGAILLIASLVHVTVYGTQLFSLAGSLYLLPYFLAGLACCRFKLPGKLHLPGVGVIWLVCGGFLVWHSLQGVVDRRSLTALLFGVSSCMLLLSSGIRLRWLAYVGFYSYSIYLFHAFFTAATRIGLEQLGVGSLLPHVIIGTALGITCPILVDRIASQNRVANTLFLGKKWSRKLPWTYRFTTAGNRSP